MRQVTTVTNLYKFGELSNEAQDKAIERVREVNVLGEWWEGIYSDASAVGFKITGYVRGEDGHLNGEFTEDAKEVAGRILASHSIKWPTYKAAMDFIQCKIPRALFLINICEEYRASLNRQFDELTGREQITETLYANDYEFTVDGTLYGPLTEPKH